MNSNNIPKTKRTIKKTNNSFNFQVEKKKGVFNIKYEGEVLRIENKNEPLDMSQEVIETIIETTFRAIEKARGNGKRRIVEFLREHPICFNNVFKNISDQIYLKLDFKKYKYFRYQPSKPDEKDSIEIFNEELERELIKLLSLKIEESIQELESSQNDSAKKFLSKLKNELPTKIISNGKVIYNTEGRKLYKHEMYLFALIEISIERGIRSHKRAKNLETFFSFDTENKILEKYKLGKDTVPSKDILRGSEKFREKAELILNEVIGFNYTGEAYVYNFITITWKAKIWLFGTRHWV